MSAGYWIKEKQKQRETGETIAAIVQECEEAGLMIDSGNIVDLAADNIVDASLQHIRESIRSHSELSKRFKV